MNFYYRNEHLWKKVLVLTQTKFVLCNEKLRFRKKNCEHMLTMLQCSQAYLKSPVELAKISPDLPFNIIRRIHTDNKRMETEKNGKNVIRWKSVCVIRRAVNL